MIRAFVDSSVLFSACFSPRGASRAMLLAGTLGTLGLVVSDVVLDEVQANLADTPHAQRLLDLLDQFLRSIPFEVVRATERQVEAAARYTELKDAPIVAAAIAAQVDYLVSLDRKHLVGVAHVARQSGLMIALPGALLAMLRS